MIGGFVIFRNGESTRVLVRSIAPSLASWGITNTMPDPTLELRDVNGTAIVEKDNWKDGPHMEIEETTLAPTNDLESAIVTTLPLGHYTTVIQERNRKGIGLVEVYTSKPMSCHCEMSPLRQYEQGRKRKNKEA